MKRQLRENYRRLRTALSTEQVNALSAEICDRLTRWPYLRDAKAVLTYLAFGNEVDLSLLIDRLPHICWAVPRVQGKELALHLYDRDHLIRHRFGMLEPSATLPRISPRQLDVVLTPGLAFDRRGGRLGFGGGFYDRLLVKTHAKRVGIAYDCCLADELPMDQHDQRMDWVFTPTQQIDCPPVYGTSTTLRDSF